MAGLADMDLQFVIRTASLVVAFCMVVVFDRKTWITADMFVSIGYGLGLVFFPFKLIDFTVEGADLTEVHLQLARVLGIVIATSSLTCHFTRDSRDGTVPVMHLMSRVFACSLLLVAQAQAHFGKHYGTEEMHWSQQNVWWNMMATFLWLLGNFIHLMRSNDFTSYPQYNVRINTHLHLDAWMKIVTATALFAYPDFPLKYLFRDIEDFDCVHLYLVRTAAVMVIGMGILSLQAPGFLHEHDKRALFLTTLLTIAGVTVVVGTQYLVYGDISWKGLRLPAIIHTPIALNAAFAYFFARGTIGYKLKSM